MGTKDTISNRNYLDGIPDAPLIITCKLTAHRPGRNDNTSNKNYLFGHRTPGCLWQPILLPTSWWNYLQGKMILLVIKITLSRYQMERYLSHENLLLIFICPNDSISIKNILTGDQMPGCLDSQFNCSRVRMEFFIDQNKALSNKKKSNWRPNKLVTIATNFNMHRSGRNYL